MHNILERDTQTGIEMAWHGLTNVVPEINKENAGIIYPMEKKPLFLQFGDELIGTPYGAVVSLDDNLPIGNAVSMEMDEKGNDTGYGLISNEAMWDMAMSSLEGTKHQVVSCGSVDNRSKVFVSIKLDEKNIVKAAGRETENVFNIMWGHGGKLGVIARTGLTVIVCQNTLNMALSRRGEFNLSIKHSRNSSARLPQMGRAIEAHLGVVAEFKRAMDEVAGIKTNNNEARKFFAGFIGRDQSGKPMEELSTRASNQVERLEALFRGGAGNKGENRADIFNAITDYFSHESSGGDDNRWKQYNSSEFGSGAANKREAYALITNPVSTNDAIRKRGVTEYNEILKVGAALLN